MRIVRPTTLVGLARRDGVHAERARQKCSPLADSVEPQTKLQVDTYPQSIIANEGRSDLVWGLIRWIQKEIDQFSRAR